MKPFSFAIGLCCAVAAPWASPTSARADDAPRAPTAPRVEYDNPADPAIFAARQKIDIHATRLLKVIGDRRALPLNTDTLTLLLNTPAVVGAAARDTWGLRPERAEKFINLTARTSSVGDGAFLARFEILVHAGRAIPRDEMDAFLSNVQKSLAQTINASNDADRTMLMQRRQSLMIRLSAAEQQRASLRQQRHELTVKSGLAELPGGFTTDMVGDMLRQRMAQQVELAAKKARLEALIKQHGDLAADKVDEKTPGPSNGAGAVVVGPAPGALAGVPTTDPNDTVTVELQKLVEATAKRVTDLVNDKYASADDIRGAQATAADALGRLANRIDELRKASPEFQIRQLKVDIAELEARTALGAASVTDFQSKARDLFAVQEEISLMNTRETLMGKRIEALGNQLEEIANREEGLSEISVTILGEDVPEKK